MEQLSCLLTIRISRILCASGKTSFVSGVDHQALLNTAAMFLKHFWTAAVLTDKRKYAVTRWVFTLHPSIVVERKFVLALPAISMLSKHEEGELSAGSCGRCFVPVVEVLGRVGRWYKWRGCNLYLALELCISNSGFNVSSRWLGLCISWFMSDTGMLFIKYHSFSVCLLDIGCNSFRSSTIWKLLYKAPACPIGDGSGRYCYGLL